MKILNSFIISIFIFTFFLPSGFLYGIPLTNIFFLLTILTFFVNVILGKNVKGINKTNLLSFLIPLIVLVIYYILNNSVTYSETGNQQFNSFLILLITPYLFLLILKNNILQVKELLNFVAFGLFFKIVIRLCIESLFIGGFFNHDSLVDFYLRVFNATPVTLYISSLNAMRIQFPSDALPLVIYSFLIFDKNISTKIKFFWGIGTGIFTLIVYSRIFIAQFVLVTLVGVLLSVKKMTVRKVFLYYFFGLMVAVLFVSVFIFSNSEISLLTDRFRGTEVTLSDYIREQQFVFIKNAFLQSPLFGNGIGYYIPGFIRSLSQLFSYELEYFSFLMQFGVIGFSLIVIGIVINFLSLINWKNLDPHSVIIVLINLLIWILKPVFNPAFLTINSASIIVMIILYSYYFSIKK